jgi:hypothetical protein
MVTLEIANKIIQREFYPNLLTSTAEVLLKAGEFKGGGEVKSSFLLANGSPDLQQESPD